jgi:hypothetical protein
LTGGAGGWDPVAAEKLLAEFEAELVRRGQEGTDQLFGNPIKLFRQSVRAYVHKAVNLASLGCRVTLENAGYSLLTHRRSNTHGWKKIPPGEEGRSSMYTIDEWMNPDLGFKWVLQQLRDREILDHELVKAAFRIKEHGDGVAHYAAKQDRAWFKELAKEHRESWTTPPVVGNEAEVLEDLRSTSEILLTLIARDIHDGVAAERHQAARALPNPRGNP